MDYLIRECKEADLAQLIVVCSKHADYEQANYNAEGKREQLEALLFLGNNKLNCFVVEKEGLIIGYATYTFDYSTWDAQKFIYLDCLYLEEGYRNYGIGQVLLEKIKSIGMQNNCVNMQWQTPEFNTNAIRFYERMGAVGKNKVRFTLTL